MNKELKMELLLSRSAEIQQTEVDADTDDIEELLKRKEADMDIDPYEIESRKEQREQMKQRSRYLSKHCRK